MRLPAAAAWGEEWMEMEEGVGKFMRWVEQASRGRRERMGGEERGGRKSSRKIVTQEGIYYSGYSRRTINSLRAS